MASTLKNEQSINKYGKMVDFSSSFLTNTVATTLVHDVSGGAALQGAGRRNLFWQHHSPAAAAHPPCSPSSARGVSAPQTHAPSTEHRRLYVRLFVPAGSWRPNVQNATRRCISVSVFFFFTPHPPPTRSLSRSLILCHPFPFNCRHFILS